MTTRFPLIIGALAMAVFGGVLSGFGLNSTPIGNLVQGNIPVLFTAGAVIGVSAWASITLAALSVCSEIVFVAMGDTRVDSLNYLLSALVVGTAGDLKIVDKGDIVTIKQRGPFASLSSPGYVIIRHGSAVVFEQYGKPSRVGFKGLVKTKPLELVRATVDLGLQQRRKQISLFTKDGVPLQAEVRADFQIHTGGRKPTPGDMYPVLEQAVLNAVYAVPDWREYTIETAVSLLRSMIAGCYLYEIYDPLKKLASMNDKPNTELKVFKDELKNSLDQVTFNWGIKIHNLEIEIKPPREIEDQALAFEKTRMEQQIAIENARTENARIREFMDQTGGTVEDYALLRLGERIGHGTPIPPSLEQILSDALERATFRASRRQERQSSSLMMKE